MLGRRKRPRVIAELPAPPGGTARPGSLAGPGLEMFTALLTELGDARAVLATGQEEKSALALGIAAAAGVAGKRAVLVECDLGAPSLARRLGLAASPGLGDYLRFEAEAPQILQSLVLAGPASGSAVAPLACIVAGAATPDAAALLGSAGFSHAMARLRSAYELVILDGPALRDPSLLPVAPFADRTLACVDRSDLPRKPPVDLDGVVVTT